MNSNFTRRDFLRAGSAALVLTALSPDRAWARSVEPHPTPRRGITGAKVLSAKELADKPKLIPLFDSVREIPGLMDGIRCSCGCANPPEYYSLLSCFEGKGMARNCIACQSQARLVARLHKEGKSLDEIRTAVDARFG